MVDQRSRQKSRELDVNGQALRLASQHSELRDFCSIDSRISSIDAESLDEDILISCGGGVLGMDPGNEALDFSSRPSCTSMDMEHDVTAATFLSAPGSGASGIMLPSCSNMMAMPSEMPIPIFHDTAAQLLQSQPYPLAAGHFAGPVIPKSPFDELFHREPVYTGSELVKQEVEEHHQVQGLKQEYAMEESMGVSMDHTNPMELTGVDSLPSPVVAGLPPVNCMFPEPCTTDIGAAAVFSTAGDAGNITSVKGGQKLPGRSKGVTMCLRTLLRQLLAGTGWIMDSSISKDHATHLIRQLVGPKLDSQLEIQLSPRRAETMSSEDKEAHYSRILADLVTRYTGKSVSVDGAQEFIKRDKGPYHLTQEFIDLLEGLHWPPQMLSERELRTYGCYRQGEASKRAKGHE